MCYGFSVLFMKDKSIKWICPDPSGDISHTDIVTSAGLYEEMDEQVFMRSFVRVEFPNWSDESYKIDEWQTLPPWFNEEECQENCVKLLHRVRPVWKKYSEIFHLNNQISTETLDYIFSTFYSLEDGKYSPEGAEAIENENNRYVGSSRLISDEMWEELKSYPGFITGYKER